MATNGGEWILLENNLSSMSSNLYSLLDDEDAPTSLKSFVESPLMLNNGMNGIPLAHRPRWTGSRRPSLEEEFMKISIEHEVKESFEENYSYQPTVDELALIQANDQFDFYENEYYNDKQVQQIQDERFYSYYPDDQYQAVPDFYIPIPEQHYQIVPQYPMPLQLISIQPNQVVMGQIIPCQLYESEPQEQVRLNSVSSSYSSVPASVDQPPSDRSERLSAIHYFPKTSILDGVTSMAVPLRQKKREPFGFNKKYPQRSQKIFNTPPAAAVNFDEKIDLKALNIGPKSLYESDQKKLFNKFKKVQKQLQDLTVDRLDIECNIFNIISGSNPADQYYVPIGYQFSQHLTCIVKIGFKEHGLVKILFKKLETLCSMHTLGTKPTGTELLKQLKHALNGLVRMEHFKTIKKDGILDISQCPDEIVAINCGLESTILSIRLIRIELWALNHLVLDWIENTEKSKTTNNNA